MWVYYEVQFMDINLLELDSEGAFVCMGKSGAECSCWIRLEAWAEQWSSPIVYAAPTPSTGTPPPATAQKPSEGDPPVLQCLALRSHKQGNITSQERLLCKGRLLPPHRHPTNKQCRRLQILFLQTCSFCVAFVVASFLVFQCLVWRYFFFSFCHAGGGTQGLVHARQLLHH